MGNLTIQLDFADDINTTGYLYKDLDITLSGDMDIRPSDIGDTLDVEAVKQGLYNIFHWAKGDRILNPEFGTNLRTYLYEGITTEVLKSIRTEITESITRWEPRVTIVSVDVIDGAITSDDHAIYITLMYTIPTLNNDKRSFNTIITK
jgi:phage baseplate assembly protein W